MRFPRVRYKPWLLLVGVGLVGAALAAREAAARRATLFRERALQHAEEIFEIADEIPPDPDWEERWFSDDPTRQNAPRRFHPPGWAPASDSDPPYIKTWRDGQARRLAYHETMKSKYEFAARYPLLPVAPDPSPPSEP